MEPQPERGPISGIGQDGVPEGLRRIQEQSSQIHPSVKERMDWEAKKNPPEIKMQLTPEEALIRDQEMETRYERADDSLVDAFSMAERVSVIDEWFKRNEGEGDKDFSERKKQKEKELLKEMLKKEEEFVFSGMVTLMPQLDMAMNKVSAQPYNTREMDYWRKNQEQYMEKKSLEGKVTNETAKKILSRFKADREWLDGGAMLTKGWAPILPKYFGGLGMMAGAVKEGGREDPLEEHYRQFFAERVGIEDEGNSWRAVGVDMNDEVYYWSMAVASVQQMERDGSMFMRDAIAVKELELIQKVFGKGEMLDFENGVKRREEVENLYAGGSSQRTIETYRYRMEALALLKVRERLDKGEDVGGIASLVNKYVEERLESEVNLGVKQKMAEMVVKSNIMAMWSHMAVDLHWGYSYEESDEEKIKMEVEGGATVVSPDSDTPAFWFTSNMADIKKDWTPSPFPMPSDEMMRKATEETGPGWAPWVDEKDWDSEIRKVLSDIERIHEEEVKKAKEKGEIEEEKEVENKLLKDVRVWEYETSVKGDNGEYISFQMIVPPSLNNSVNFWRVVTLPEEKDAPDGLKGAGYDDVWGKSVWEALSEGKKISELPWGVNRADWYYRSLITMSQTAMMVKLLRQEPSKANEEDWLKFFGDFSSIREFKKRSDLGGRDEKMAKEMFSLGMVGLMIPLWKINDKMIGVREGRATKAGLKDFAETTAWWMQATMDLKDKKSRKDFELKKPHVIDFGSKAADLMVYYIGKFVEMNEVLVNERGLERVRYLNRLRKEAGLPRSTTN